MAPPDSNALRCLQDPVCRSVGTSASHHLPLISQQPRFSGEGEAPSAFRVGPVISESPWECLFAWEIPGDSHTPQDTR